MFVSAFLLLSVCLCLFASLCIRSLYRNLKCLRNGLRVRLRNGLRNRLRTGFPCAVNANCFLGDEGMRECMRQCMGGEGMRGRGD